MSHSVPAASTVARNLVSSPRRFTLIWVPYSTACALVSSQRSPSGPATMKPVEVDANWRLRCQGMEKLGSVCTQNSLTVESSRPWGRPAWAAASSSSSASSPPGKEEDDDRPAGSASVKPPRVRGGRSRASVSSSSPAPAPSLPPSLPRARAAAAPGARRPAVVAVDGRAGPRGAGAGRAGCVAAAGVAFVGRGCGHLAEGGVWGGKREGRWGACRGERERDSEVERGAAGGGRPSGDVFFSLSLLALHAFFCAPRIPRHQGPWRTLG